MVSRRTASRMLAGAALAAGGLPFTGRARAAAGGVTHDVAVIGAGAFGAWTAHALNASGLRVALVDAYGPANDRASSGGESRIIRSAYGAAEIYARWARDALPLWKALELRQRTRIFEPTGVVTIHRQASSFGDDTAKVLDALQVPYERLTASATMQRFPQFTLAKDEAALFEPQAGALFARRAIQTLVAELQAAGVDYHLAAAESPRGSGRLEAVNCHGAPPILATSYVFACGPWLPKVFPALLGDRIRSQRGEVFFLGARAGDVRYLPPAMPTWIDDTEPGGAYGMPSLEGRGVKVAVDAIDLPIDPDTGERTVTAPYAEAMRAFVRRRFPGLSDAPVVETRVCQYEMTPDENYILAPHPDFTNVWIAGGGSGHGFKTAPVVGAEVARLVLGTANPDPRFALARRLA